MHCLPSILLAACGQLVVVLASQGYRQAKIKPDHAEVFDRLIEAATEVVVMPQEAANRELLRCADRLVAVWDG